jgi:hypothetical protein
MRAFSAGLALVELASAGRHLSFRSWPDLKVKALWLVLVVVVPYMGMLRRRYKA